MRRFPAINQLNPRRDGPIPIADQMFRTLCPQLPRPVNHLRPGTKSPQRRPRSSIADYLQFSTPPAGSRPQPVQFQCSARRQLWRGRSSVRRAARQMLVSRFLGNRGGASHLPASVSYDRPYGDTGRSGTQVFVGELRRIRWQWRGHSDGGDAWPSGNGRRGAGNHPRLVGGRAWSWTGIWRSSWVSRWCSRPIAAYLRWGIGRALYPHFVTKPPKTKRRPVCPLPLPYPLRRRYNAARHRPAARGGELAISRRPPAGGGSGLASGG